MKTIGPFKKYTKRPNDIRYGQIYTMEVKLPILYSKKRTVRVYLPEDFDENKKYPVLFMADGQNIVDKYISAYGAWDIDLHQHHLLKKGYRSFIVVGIDCPFNPVHRALEYSFPFMRMNPDEEGRELSKSSLKFESHLLYKYMALELLPLVREYFPIEEDKKFVGAGGSSMGGIFSLSLVLSYPELFGYGLVFSPGIFLYSKRKVKAYFDERLPNLSDHKFYFYSGNTGFEEKFLERTESAYHYFKKNGLKDNVHLLKDLDADHNEASWSKHFEEAIKFWLNKNA